MKIISQLPSSRRSRRPQGFALLMVLVMIGVSLIVLAGAMNRASTVATLNNRNNEYTESVNAAEAAVEKAYAMINWQFMAFGVRAASNMIASGVVSANVPSPAEDARWADFVFSDAQGNYGSTYVSYVSNYSGQLPLAFAGLATVNAPVYRIVSNVVKTNSMYAGAVDSPIYKKGDPSKKIIGTNTTVTGIVGTAQVDVLLALVPLAQWAIFYNGQAEFVNCAPMTVRGVVQINGDLLVGSSSPLNFNDMVNIAGSLTWGQFGIYGPYQNTSPALANYWNVSFGPDSYSTNVMPVNTSLGTNSHYLIEMPASGTPAQQDQVYNKAQMVLIVSNGLAGMDPTVLLKLQLGGDGINNSLDPSPTMWMLTNASPDRLATNFPFLALTNSFYDQREHKYTMTADMDMGAFATWVGTNNTVKGKLDPSHGVYPTVVYVANQQQQAGKLPVVRLNNGSRLPYNGGMGLGVGTPNPLYVRGDYNTMTNTAGPSSAATTNTAYTVPAALLADAITVLSGNWNDAVSSPANPYFQGNAGYAAKTTTINAALVSGDVPTVGSGAAAQQSGGVMNLTRLLEDWGNGLDANRALWLNTSILRLWDSQVANSPFLTPGTYYNAPIRNFTFDRRFMDPNTVPPGIPSAMLAIRFSWDVPPPGTVTYSKYGHN